MNNILNSLGNEIPFQYFIVLLHIFFPSKILYMINSREKQYNFYRTYDRKLVSYSHV